MPSTMKPKCDTDVYAISREMLFCPMATSAPYRMLTTASTTTTGVAHTEASGKIPRQNRTIPNVPILSRMLTSSTDVPGVACCVVSGSQVCTGNIGALIANATKKPTKSQRPVEVEMSRRARSEIRYDGGPALALST